MQIYLCKYQVPTWFRELDSNHINKKQIKYTFRISFFLKKSTVRKNGKSPIIVRITLNGEKVEFSTKQSIESSKWDVDTGEAKGNSYECVSINNDLNSIRMTIYTYYRNLSEKCEIVTAEKLRRMYTQTEMYPQTPLTLFKKHNDDELKLVGYGRVMIHTKNMNWHTDVYKNLCSINMLKKIFIWII